MTKGQQLIWLTSRHDWAGIYAWCKQLCYWFDPGGYFGANDFKESFWKAEAIGLSDDKLKIIEDLRPTFSNFDTNSESFKREYECMWGNGDDDNV